MHFGQHISCYIFFCKHKVLQWKKSILNKYLVIQKHNLSDDDDDDNDDKLQQNSVSKTESTS